MSHAHTRNTGWSPQKRDGDASDFFADLNALSAAFSLDSVNGSSSQVNYAKLESLQQLHLSRASNDRLVDGIKADFPDDDGRTTKIVGVVRSRMRFESELADLVRPFYYPLEKLDLGGEECAKIKTKAFKAYPDVDTRKSALEEFARDVRGKIQKKSMPLLRWAITAKDVGPPLPEIVDVLGDDVVSNRLTAAIDFVENEA